MFEDASITPPNSPMVFDFDDNDTMACFNNGTDFLDKHISFHSDENYKKEEFLYSTKISSRYRKKYFSCLLPIKKESLESFQVSQQLTEQEGLLDLTSHFVMEQISMDSKLVSSTFKWYKCNGNAHLCKYCWTLEPFEE